MKQRVAAIRAVNIKIVQWQNTTLYPCQGTCKSTTEFRSSHKFGSSRCSLHLQQKKTALEQEKSFKHLVLHIVHIRELSRHPWQAKCKTFVVSFQSTNSVEIFPEVRVCVRQAIGEVAQILREFKRVREA